MFYWRDGSTLSIYSQGSNSEYSNSESIRKPNISKFGFQMFKTIYIYGPEHSKTELWLA